MVDRPVVDVPNHLRGVAVGDSSQLQVSRGVGGDHEADVGGDAEAHGTVIAGGGIGDVGNVARYDIIAADQSFLSGSHQSSYSSAWNTTIAVFLIHGAGDLCYGPQEGVGVIEEDFYAEDVPALAVFLEERRGHGNILGFIGSSARFGKHMHLLAGAEHCLQIARFDFFYIRFQRFVIKYWYMAGEVIVGSYVFETIVRSEVGGGIAGYFRCERFTLAINDVFGGA